MPWPSASSGVVSGSNVPRPARTHAVAASVTRDERQLGELDRRRSAVPALACLVQHEPPVRSSPIRASVADLGEQQDLAPEVLAREARGVARHEGLARGG